MLRGYIFNQFLNQQYKALTFTKHTEDILGELLYIRHHFGYVSVFSSVVFQGTGVQKVEFGPLSLAF